MVKIHSTAIIDPKAQLSDDVIIGAYSIIGPNVKIDVGCQVGNHVVITGHTTIGKNNKFYHFSSIGEAPQDKKYAGEPTELIIGNDNTLREFITMNTGSIDGGGITRVGNNNWLMAYVHIAHDCMVGNNTIMANNSTLGGHVTIQDWVILGGMTAVHQFSTIGAHAMTAGGTIVRQDIPPYVMCSPEGEPKGINIEGLKRRGFTPLQIDNIRNAYKVLFRNDLLYSEAKSQIFMLAETQPELKAFLEFFEVSQRSIIR